MAGQRIMLGGSVCFIDYADGEGKAVVNGKEWRWEFHRYCGPSFLRKDGEFLKRQPGERNPVWGAFNEWLRKWQKRNPETRRKSKKDRIKLDIK